MRLPILALLLSLQASLSLAQPAAVAAPASAATYDLILPAPPSLMLDRPLADWLPLGRALDETIRRELTQSESLPVARKRELLVWQALLLQLRGEWTLVPATLERARRLQEGSALRLSSGLVTDLLAQMKRERRDAPWLRRAVRERFAALPWNEVGGTVRTLHRQLRDTSVDGLRKNVAEQVDPMVSGSNGRVTLALGMRLVGTRLLIEHTLPVRDALVDGLSDLLAQHPEPAR